MSFLNLELALFSVLACLALWPTRQDTQDFLRFFKIVDRNARSHFFHLQSTAIFLFNVSRCRFDVFSVFC